MAEWESSYGGRVLKNARILTREEITKRYPDPKASRMAILTYRALENGFDILYGESPHPKPGLGDDFEGIDVLVTSAYLYGLPPDEIKTGAFTDLSKDNAIYAAVKPKYRRK